MDFDNIHAKKLVKNLNKPGKPKKPETNTTLEAIYRDLEEKMKQKLSTKVSIKPKGDGSGKIEIEFYNHEDLDRIFDSIRN